MKAFPFNSYNVGILPNTFCKRCGEILESTINITAVPLGAPVGAPDKREIEVSVHHPKNDCRHSDERITIPTITLADLT